MTSLVETQLNPAPRMWLSYKIGLDALNHRVNRDESGEPINSNIDDRLKSQQDSPWSWERLFEAERLLVPLMADEDLAADMVRRVERARDWQMQETDRFKTAFDEAQDPATKRALYEQFIDCLHYAHFRRAAMGQVRRGTAFWMNFVGVVVLGATIAVLVLAALEENGERYFVEHHVLVVMWFGLLGAYLSRMMAFQLSFDSLDYERMKIDFSIWSLFVRLIVGSLAALIFYLLIVGQLVGGEFFPDLEGGSFLEQTKPIKEARDESAAPDVAAAAQFDQAMLDRLSKSLSHLASNGGSETALTFSNTETGKSGSTGGGTASEKVRQSMRVSADFAKLLVWATLAGFSERLLPDRLRSMTKTRKDDASAPSNGGQPETAGS